MKSCVIDTWRKYGWYFRYCSVAPWAIPHQNTEYGDGRVTNKGKQCQNAWIWHSLYPADNGRQQSHVRCWCWVELSTNLREVSQCLELAFSLSILKATHRLWHRHPTGTSRRLVDSSSAEAHIVTLSRLWSIPLLSYFYTQPLSAQLQCVFFVASSIFYLEAVFSGQSHKNKSAKRVHLCINVHMSQMLYAGQSAREDVPFPRNFWQLYRAQFMCKCCEILIHESQPICHPSGQISWTLANFMAWFMAAQNWP